jgi:thioester reductase-like protein
MDLLDKRLFIIPITNYTEPFWGLSKKKYSDLQSAINIVVHCAANVNHFTVIDESMKSNVNVTTSIARFCSVKHIKLFHISTMSVSSVDFPNLNNNVNSLIKKFDERSLWINQPTSNTYVQSKLLAELQLINLSMNKIINLSIIRLGNLANNSVDGSFQTNYDKNAFALMIRSWILLKNIPNYLKNKLIDISPIDKTCDAIIKILDYDNHEFNIYHAYTSKLIRLDKLIYYLNKCGYRISFISSNKFKAVLQRNHKSRKWEQIFMGLFPFLTNNSIVKLNNDIDIRNEITTIFLNKCNFNWIDINLNYIKKYVKFFEKHYFFNVA